MFKGRFGAQFLLEDAQLDRLSSPESKQTKLDDFE